MRVHKRRLRGADLEDGTLTGNLAWTSDLDGPLGTGGSFTRPLSAGTHHLTAMVSDSGGLRGGAVELVQRCGDRGCILPSWWPELDGHDSRFS